MVKYEVMIDRDLETVWHQIEEEFCKVFKCKAGELADREIETEAKSYYGSPIHVSQKISEYVPGQAIEMESVRGADVVTSRYTAETAGAAKTKVALALQGRNKKSVLRTWNYALMSWPILRSGTKKKLRRQLLHLKAVIESKGV